MQRPMKFHLCALLFLAAAFMAASAHAQSAAPEQEPQREARLLGQARKEGSLTLYTSMVNRDIAQLAKAFEEKYGVKVVYWRGSAQNVLQRVVTESRGGRDDVDVVQAPTLVMEALHHEQLLQRVRSPLLNGLRDGAVPPHGTWAALRVYVYVQAYNTAKVGKDELPRSYEDLLDPRWKGRLGTEAKAQVWFRTLLEQMGEEKGAELFRKIVAANGMSVRSGNSLLNNLVVSGEVPFALSVYSYMPEKAKAGGAPIDYIALSPTIAYTDGIGVMSKPRHPAAAALFLDFMLSDGLKIMKDQGQLTMHKRDAGELDRFKPVFVDPARMLDGYDKWTEFYQDLVAGRPAQLPKEGGQ